MGERIDVAIRYFYTTHREQWQQDHGREYFGIIFPAGFPFAEPRFYFAGDVWGVLDILNGEKTEGEVGALGSIDKLHTGGRMKPRAYL